MADSRTTSQSVQLYRLPARERAASPTPDCVVALKALGEDTRVRIIGLLLDAPLSVNQISTRVGASQHNVSKHLRILREAGLLKVQKTGRRRLYALTDGIAKQAAEGGILDLGCCTFTFEGPTDEPPRSHTRSRRRPAPRVVSNPVR